MTKTQKGVIFIIGASISFGLCPSLVKMLLQKGMPSTIIIFYRFLLTFIFLLIWVNIKKLPLSISKKHFLQLNFFGIIGNGLTVLFIAYSTTYISSGMTSMLHFCYPVIVLIIMTVFFSEKISRYNILAIILAVAGLMTLNRNLNDPISIKGVIFGVLSGLTYAIYVVSNKKSSYASINPIICVFYISLSCVIFFGVWSVLSNGVFLPSDITIWLLLMLNAALGSTGLLLILKGVAVLGASKASMINMLEPITGVIAGAAFLKENITLLMAIGFLFIIASISITATAKNE